MDPLEVGDAAPDFTLPVLPGDSISLSGMLEEHSFVVLAFFPALGSEACRDEALIIEAVIDYIAGLGAGVVGVITGDIDLAEQWSEELGLSFPLASDAESGGAVARSYGVDHEDGACKRAQFIVDRARKIQLSHVVPRDTSPGAHAVIKRLEELNASARD
jgi:peroxiredoxin